MKAFWNKKLPAFLLAVLMMATLVPAAGAASVDKTYEVDEDDYVWLDADDFQEIYEDLTYDGDLEYIKFSSYDDFDDYGYFAFTDFDDYDYDDVDYYDLDSYHFYYDYYNTDAEKDDIDLDTLKFVAYDDIDSASLNFTVKLYGDEGTKTIAVRIDVEGSGASSNKIIYEVEPGKKTAFSAADFYEFFEDNYSSSYDLSYVIFDRPASSAFSEGTLYYNYGKSSEESFTRSSLASAWFYYDPADATATSDYPLDKLSFVADRTFESDVELTFTAYSTSSRYVEGTLVLTTDGSSSSSKVEGDIVYEMDENDEITFDEEDFNDFFQETYAHYDFYYIRFTDITNMDECGDLTTYTYDDRDGFEEVTLDEDDALDGYFYYDDEDVQDAAHQYCLDGLGFSSDRNTDGEVVTLDFTAYGTSTSRKVNGTLVIEIGDVKNSSASKGDVEYEAAPGEEVLFDEEDFNDFFQDTYSSYDFKYLYFTDSENLGNYNGNVYYNYGRSSEKRFTATTLENAYFYYDDRDVPDDADDCYPLEDLSFVASSAFDTTVTLDFTLYYNNSRQVDGTLTISPTGKTQTANVTASILYTTTSGTKVQLKANDFVRFYESAVKNSTLQSVKLMGVPAAGGLYYNYYKASSYGTTAQLPLTAYNCGTQALYVSPANNTQYALTELTYVPSGVNYCASIPFAASGTGGYTVYGSVMISVTSKAIPEVYGATPKNTAVTFPAPAISSAVSSGTASTLASIQLLKLPASTVGAVYVGTGTTRTATTSDLYSVSGGTWTISQLRFVPANNYTGNVEIPYAALDAAGKTIGVGTFSLGVVNKQVKFSDVTSSAWCYKYVAEMSDANIISGYSNGTFKPDSTISYGAALKLIMLAAGYSEQAPTVAGSAFSGYLAKARADGLITRSNVNLSAPISRLQVAQLAAGAMKLNLNNLSSVKPFTDTSDPYVQALNAAGIIEGYFNNGTYTYKPNNTLTRGQVSAIIWRMQNYK